MTAAQYHAASAKRRHKYGAKRTVVDGIKFDSKGEALRWITLKHQERAGLINLLTRQRRFPLHGPNGTLIGHYVSDFDYIADTARVVEDHKGYDLAFAKWKRKHFADEYGIKILLTGPAAKRRRSA